MTQVVQTLPAQIVCVDLKTPGTGEQEQPDDKDKSVILRRGTWNGVRDNNRRLKM